ncbi:hypothetical protein COCNU_scaffold002267G000040 [Cocos nucifera]|nr:hypothetical protein [Cocos nucifera]
MDLRRSTHFHCLPPPKPISLHSSPSSIGLHSIDHPPNLALPLHEFKEILPNLTLPHDASIFSSRSLNHHVLKSLFTPFLYPSSIYSSPSHPSLMVVIDWSPPILQRHMPSAPFSPYLVINLIPKSP